MINKELFRKLEKKNPQKAYFLELCRKDAFGMFSVVYFGGTFMGLIGFLIKPFNLKLEG